MNTSKRSLLLIMIVTLTIFGGALLYFTVEFLSEVSGPDVPPIQGMGRQLGMLLLVVTMLAGMPAVGMGAYVMYIGSGIRLTRQWPPAGMGFRTEAPVLLGDRATGVGVLVMGLGLVLVVCGLMLPIIGWQVSRAFFE
jgi:hypothetical protein